MGTEKVAGEENPVLLKVGDHGFRPVDPGSVDEPQGLAPKGEGLVVLHHLVLIGLDGVCKRAIAAWRGCLNPPRASCGLNILQLNTSLRRYLFKCCELFLFCRAHRVRIRGITFQSKAADPADLNRAQLHVLSTACLAFSKSFLCSFSVP